MPQILAALLGGVLLFLISVGALTGGYQLSYSGKILPGVSVGGVDISALTPEEAALKLNQNLTYPYTGRILFRDGDKVWLAAPAQLGMVFDLGASLQSAYRVGRSGGLFDSLTSQVNAWQRNVNLPPVILFDGRVAYEYLQAIAAQIDIPVVEASLTIQGTQVSDTPGQVGRLLDVDATLANLMAQLQSFQDGEVPLIVAAQAPQILDASPQAAAARQILSAPLVLSLADMQSGDPGPWEVNVQTLANMLLVERAPAEGGGAQYLLSLNAAALGPFLEGLAASLDRDPVNASFTFNDETRQLELIQPAVIGRKLDVEATLAAIQEKALQGEHNIPLALIYTQPDVGSDATAESLGITGLVSNPDYSYTYFHTSKSERIQNIKTAARKFHGLLIAPGQTFSMAEALGDISLENGFQEALIISNGRTIKGVGGGVCQVSTTLFRTVFFAGYPIVERHAHAYRVGYYEQTQYGGHDPKFAGLDATVYVPLVDFKFTNDTPYWLLMETYVNDGASRLTWMFYSTNDSRTVEWNTTGPQDVVPAPEPLFQENSDLEPGEIKQVDWSAEGANVTVTRIVWRGGQVLYNDPPMITRYKAWQAVCEYGPGTENPQSLAAEKGLCQQ